MSLDTENEYKNGKIYMITYEDCKKPYYGSTIQSLNVRFGTHKSDYKLYLNKKISSYCTSYEITKNKNCYIKLIENFSCNNRSELEYREQYYRTNFICINKTNPSSKKSRLSKKYDYSKGKIYIITYENCEKPYYGSTIQTLNNRLARHRYECKNTIGDKELNNIINNKNHYIKLVENFPCKSKLELRIREQYFIDNNVCANIFNAYTSEKVKKEQQKIIQEKKNIKKKEVVLCECGKSITKGHLAEHIKSKKHQDFINNVPQVELTEEEKKKKKHRDKKNKKFYEKKKVK